MEKQHKTTIGGQAVIEGIMMKGVNKTSLAVRLPNGEIDIETWSTESEKSGKWFRKTPFIRGIFNLVDTLILGYKCITKSAEKAGLDDEEELSPFEQKMMLKFGNKFMTFIEVVSVIIGVLLALFLFIVVPTFVTSLIDKYLFEVGGLRTLIEGVLKIAILIAYMALVSLLKDIRRVFEYHGAEHKSIACYEAGEELTPANAMKHKRFHPRCGTSFILIILVISMILFAVISIENPLIRIALKVVLLPVTIGISYEIIKFVGRHDNIFTRIISAPGMWLQKITTKEPDESQLEVAIAALNAVLTANREDDKW